MAEASLQSKRKQEALLHVLLNLLVCMTGAGVREQMTKNT